MIVRCQQCQRAYELPPEVIQRPTLDKGSYGWWFECDGCQAFWWEPAAQPMIQDDFAKNKQADSNHFEQRVVDDSTPLTQEKPTSSIHSSPDNTQPYFDKKMFSSFSIPSQGGYNPKLTIPIAEEWPIGNVNIKTRASTPSKRIFGIIFSLSFLTLTIIAILFYLYRDGVMNMARLLTYSSPLTQKKPSSDLNLQIRDVKYDIQVVGSRKTVLVIGEVHNPHKPLISIRPLQVVVWGRCKENGGTLGPKKDLCKIVSWNHEWSKTYVNSGEVIPFQTVGSVTLEDDVVKVDVTLP